MRPIYKQYALDALQIFAKYPKMGLEARAVVVRQMILEYDPNIWGLVTFAITAQELADCYARMVVGHEGN